jgi:hypothetical protein
MKIILYISKTIIWTLLLWSVQIQAQTLIKGRVSDRKKEKLAGANVFLKGTYDGSTADTEGRFSFSTSEKDTAVIQVSFVGYEPYSQKIKLSKTTLEFDIVLEEQANELNTVVISAGAFEASDEKKMTMLKPLDIVTTAGAGADITAVMQLLPGATRVGEREGLFVRGGSALETKVVIDGMIVQNPFNSSLPDLPARGRFNPFQFKGTSFSTGGYSAQYGQALSSVLLLQTIDKPEATSWNLGANLIGINLGRTITTDKSSVSVTGYYGNLAPLFALVKQNVEWLEAPNFAGGVASYILNTSKTGLLKASLQYSNGATGIMFRNPDNNLGTNEFRLSNQNIFGNTTFRDFLNSKNTWFMQAGFSYSRNRDDINIGTIKSLRFDEMIQRRVVFTHYLPKNSTLILGTEGHNATVGISDAAGKYYEVKEDYNAAFAEGELYISRALAARVGLRTEHAGSIDKWNFAPRVSLAYKTGLYSQVSLASGIFWQTPDKLYLFRNPNLEFEKATHFIANYQIIKDKRTIRTEFFYKRYDNLVKENTQGQRFDANPNRFPWGVTNNTGTGYAQGFDVFFRDQKTLKNADFWLTYSYVDTKRNAQNFVSEAMPTFASNHNFSAIFKYFLGKPRMSMSATYTHTSGRPYYNPNNAEFLADRTPSVNLVSLSASYLTNIGGHFSIIYATMDNVFDASPVFTYRYSTDGKERLQVGPANGRSFFVGVIINISKKKTLTREMQNEVLKE